MTEGRLDKLFSSIQMAVTDYFGKLDISANGVHYKDNREIFTRADKDIEAVIIDLILNEFPAHKIVSEEKGVTGSGDMCWYIDPVDNTVGLVFGEKDISVSIALKNGGRHLRSMVINPRTGEVFEAGPEGGFKNGCRLAACPDSLFDGRGLSTCAYVRREYIPAMLRIMGILFEKRIPLRISGGSALDLCYLAEGRTLAHVSLGAHTWDVEAGLHMVKSAGGAVEILALFPERNALALLAAASPSVLGQLKELLGGAIDPEVIF
jgi:myo-inositol-1(or 4)-monophosphatase